jgi:hypothetical protein
VFVYVCVPRGSVPLYTIHIYKFMPPEPLTSVLLVSVAAS